MNTHADKIQKNKSQSVSAANFQMQSSGESTFQFVDNRPEAIAQRKLQEIANSSPRTAQLRAFQVKNSKSLPVSRDEVVQRQLKASGTDVEHGKQILSNAYRVGLPETENGTLGFNKTGKNDSWGTPLFDTVETQRPEPENDGIGSHLIGKIIDDGDVSIYFGEDTMDNNARPTNPEASDQGLASGGEIFLNPGASAIQLIHELIHTYHFAFDPWNAAQKNQDIETNGVHDTAEETSTVGLGQWDDFELTENAFRGEMDLPIRDKYTGWVEPN